MDVGIMYDGGDLLSCCGSGEGRGQALQKRHAGSTSGILSESRPSPPPYYFHATRHIYLRKQV